MAVPGFVLCPICLNKELSYWPFAQLPSQHAIGAGSLGFKSRIDQIGTVSPTTRHRYDVSSELHCPGAKPRRWAPQLVTRFGVIPRVGYNEDLFD